MRGAGESNLAGLAPLVAVCCPLPAPAVDTPQGLIYATGGRIPVGRVVDLSCVNQL